MNSLAKTSFEKFVLWIATGCGIGMIAPFAPGTFGSLPGVLLSLWTVTMPIPLQVIFAVGLALMAIPICTVAENILAKKDDGRISADEWMLFPLAVIGLPLLETWWLLPVCFVVVRIVDIVKPQPANRLQRLPAGFGIVADDFVANLYSLAINWCIWLAYSRYLAD
jgi:phosphatidylglycerophosphatase A